MPKISDKELVEIILDSNERLRFAGVLDEKKELVSCFREGTKNLLSESETHKSAIHALERWHLRRIFENKIGLPEYTLSEYKTVKRATIQLEGNKLLLISMDKDSDHDRIISKILEIKKEHYP